MQLLGYIFWKLGGRCSRIQVRLLVLGFLGILDFKTRSDNRIFELLNMGRVTRFQVIGQSGI